MHTPSPQLRPHPEGEFERQPMFVPVHPMGSTSRTSPPSPNRDVSPLPRGDLRAGSALQRGTGARELACNRHTQGGRGQDDGERDEGEEQGVLSRNRPILVPKPPAEAGHQTMDPRNESE